MRIIRPHAIVTLGLAIALASTAQAQELCCCFHPDIDQDNDFSPACSNQPASICTGSNIFLANYSCIEQVGEDEDCITKSSSSSAEICSADLSGVVTCTPLTSVPALPGWRGALLALLLLVGCAAAARAGRNRLRAVG